MDDWKLPNYAAAAGGSDPENGDDETLLAEHEDGSEDEGKELEGGASGGRKSIKGTLWIFLMTTATLAARRILNGGFRKLSFSLPLDMSILRYNTC